MDGELSHHSSLMNANRGIERHWHIYADGETLKKFFSLLFKLLGRNCEKYSWKQIFQKPSFSFFLPLTAALHNSESTKDQIGQHKFASGRKSLFHCSLKGILKRRLISRSRTFATFSAIEKAVVGRIWPMGRMLCRPGLRSRWNSTNGGLIIMADRCGTVLFITGWLSEHRKFKQNDDVSLQILL